MKKKNKKALLIIDMLNDFVLVGAPLECPGAGKIVPNIKKQIKKAREEDIPVIYICDSHRKNDPEFKVWPPHCVKGTKGAEVVDDLKPEKGDIVIKKVTYSGFFGTDLDEVLKKLKVKELIVTGVCSEICVLFTSADALMRGYKVRIPKGCTAGLTKAGHRFAVNHINNTLIPRG